MGTLSTLWITAQRLWFSVPRWRWLTIAAILTSIGALLSDMVGSNSGSQQAGPGGIPSPPVAQPSSTTSSTTSSATRPSGRISPGPPIDHQAQLRLENFYKTYKQVENNPAAGARCDARATALARLASNDEAVASPAQKDAITDTRSKCVDVIRESDSRIRTAVAAWEKYKSHPSAESARDVLEATLTDFDRERNLSAKGLPAGEISTLRSAVLRYDEIIDRAVTVAALYRPGDPATLDSAISLAEGWTELGKLPFPVVTSGLPAREVKAIEAMKSAEGALGEADHRSGVLRTALGRAQADPKGLAIALALLTPFDQARAKAVGVDLVGARSIARDAIPKAIEPAAKNYAANPTRADAEALVGLGQLAKDLDARLDPATADVVTQAARHIMDSNQRLAELRRVAHDWIIGRTKGTPDKALDDKVRDVYRVYTGGTGQLYAFDRAAATAADDDALQTINVAMLEIEGRLVPGTSRRSVAIRVDTSRLSSIDVVAKSLPAALTKQLASAGFVVVSNAGEAVLTLALSDSSVRSLSMDATGRQQRQVLIAATATWRFSGKIARLGDLEANGADRDPARALDQAIDAVAANIVRSLGALISQ